MRLSTSLTPSKKNSRNFLTRTSGMQPKPKRQIHRVQWPVPQRASTTTQLTLTSLWVKAQRKRTNPQKRRALQRKRSPQSKTSPIQLVTKLMSTLIPGATTKSQKSNRKSANLWSKPSSSGRESWSNNSSRWSCNKNSIEKSTDGKRKN